MIFKVTSAKLEEFKPRLIKLNDKFPATYLELSLCSYHCSWHARTCKDEELSNFSVVHANAVVCVVGKLSISNTVFDLVTRVVLNSKWSNKQPGLSLHYLY